MNREYYKQKKQRMIYLRILACIVVILFIFINCIPISFYLRNKEPSGNSIVIGPMATSANDNAPVLIFGAKIANGSEQDTVYDFKVVYLDQDNNAPYYVWAVVDSVQYSMVPEDPGDVNYTDGCTHALPTPIELEPGNHTFHFTCSDGNYTCTTTPLSFSVDNPGPEYTPLGVYIVLMGIAGAIFAAVVSGFTIYKKGFVNKARITVVNPTPRHPFSPGEFKEFAARIDSELPDVNTRAPRTPSPPIEEYVTPLNAYTSFMPPDSGLLPPSTTEDYLINQDEPDTSGFQGGTVDDSTGIRTRPVDAGTSQQSNLPRATFIEENEDGESAVTPEEYPDGNINTSSDGSEPSIQVQSGQISQEDPRANDNEAGASFLKGDVDTNVKLESTHVTVPTKAIGLVEPRVEARLGKTMRISKYVCKQCKIKTLVKNPEPGCIYLCPRCEENLTLLARCKNCGSSLAMKSQEALLSSEVIIKCPICHEKVVI
ncbi:MAG: hypothetical protein ACFFCS_09665 [Candidatus Hodarchaeota archaeon]